MEKREGSRKPLQTAPKKTHSAVLCVRVHQLLDHVKDACNLGRRKICKPVPWTGKEWNCLKQVLWSCFRFETCPYGFFFFLPFSTFWWNGGIFSALLLPFEGMGRYGIVLLLCQCSKILCNWLPVEEVGINWCRPWLTGSRNFFRHTYDNFIFWKIVSR